MYISERCTSSTSICYYTHSPHIYIEKVNPAYKLVKNREQINQPFYMDYLKLYTKNEKKFDSLIETVRMFSKEIGIELRDEKCSMLVKKRGKRIKSDRIKLPDDIAMKLLKEEERYKYLGVLQANEVQKKR